MELNDQAEKGYCEIRVKGKLEPRWTEWFDPMNVGLDSDVTVISGFVPDQPALQGLMEKIGMLGMKIISIKFVSGSNAETPGRFTADDSDDADIINDFRCGFRL